MVLTQDTWLSTSHCLLNFKGLVTTRLPLVYTGAEISFMFRDSISLNVVQAQTLRIENGIGIRACGYRSFTLDLSPNRIFH